MKQIYERNRDDRLYYFLVTMCASIMLTLTNFRSTIPEELFTCFFRIVQRLKKALVVHSYGVCYN